MPAAAIFRRHYAAIFDSRVFLRRRYQPLATELPDSLYFLRSLFSPIFPPYFRRFQIFRRHYGFHYFRHLLIRAATLIAIAYYCLFYAAPFALLPIFSMMLYFLSLFSFRRFSRHATPLLIFRLRQIISAIDFLRHYLIDAFRIR